MDELCHQYIDELNIKYLRMNKEKRLKNLSSIAKRIAGFRFDADHIDILEVVKVAARERGRGEGDIRLEGLDYPEEVLW